MKVAIGMLVMAVSLDPYFGSLGNGCNHDRVEFTCFAVSTKYMEMIGNRHGLDASQSEIIRHGVEHACETMPWTREVKACLGNMTSPNDLAECWPKRGQGAALFDVVDKASMQLQHSTRATQSR